MTTIGPSVTFSGELTSTEDLRIEGRIDGHVIVREAALVIGQSAHVKADVRGVRVIVEGRVDGSIAASERIELTPSAHVEGSLSANQVVLVDGARFSGRIDMDQRTIAAKLAQYKAAHGEVVAQR
jgi:cytoskeletal protein CcmA (bactofilin family)